ncbi:uncharacterized protein FSUBG_1920 [Fusarium subglutinans]|uniref:Uncharacterized protein n=1 Tax=Gibberella subglutinans TaxID=42677 RepID=A0A8H5QC38_GIBSU|nr:uncharacterized protein FSUBG_1920 [Fusarium subglutinans]KAF5611893.1 hypothetical protein FSUBG_1920 [Fusarium subglutinans]
MGMQAQGHSACSGVTAYWGCLCLWSDEEEAYETPVTFPPREVTFPPREVTSGTPLPGALDQGDEGTEHRIERSMDAMDAARRSVNGEGTEHRIERAVESKELSTGSSVRAVELRALSNVDVRSAEAGACKAVQRDTQWKSARSSCTGKAGDVSIAFRIATQKRKPSFPKPEPDLLSQLYLLLPKPQISTANDTTGSQLGHYTATARSWRQVTGWRRWSHAFRSEVGRANNTARASTGTWKWPSTSLAHKQPQTTTQLPLSSTLSQLALICIAWSSLKVGILIIHGNGIKDEHLYGKTRKSTHGHQTTKPFCTHFFKSAYGHGGDAVVKDEEMEEGDSDAVVKDEEMEEDDSAVVKDECMYVWCSKRQFDRAGAVYGHFHIDIC